MEQPNDNAAVQHNGSELRNFRFLRRLTKDDDPKFIQEIWEKIRQQDYAFDDFSRNNPQLFLLGLISETSFYFLVEDAGIAIVNDLWENSTSANVHFCMWDKSYPWNKTVEAAKEFLAWIFTTYNCHRINAYIPDYNTYASRLATNLRFKYEGCMKETVLYKGKWFDQKIFGLLQSTFNKVVM